MQLKEIWDTTVEIRSALNNQYGPAMDEIAINAGLEGPERYLLLPAITFEPEPMSTKQLRVRSPYTAPERYDKALEILQNKGFLSQVKDGFLLTDEGRSILMKMIDAAYTHLKKLSPLPQNELQELADLLHRLVEACLNAPEPPGKWSILLSRKIDSGKDANEMIRIDQYISDLAAYRDDAHLASWQMHRIPAHAWETFTFFWRGSVSTIDELVTQLEIRGYDRNDYIAASQLLMNTGWLKEIDHKIAVTDLGAQIRQEAEELTDDYFFSPWNCLSDQSQEYLLDLLHQFRGGFLGDTS